MYTSSVQYGMVSLNSTYVTPTSVKYSLQISPFLYIPCLRVNLPINNLKFPHKKLLGNFVFCKLHNTDADEKHSVTHRIVVKES